mmetsp:Transcript_23985/g.51771  ORF Transcript_23985/g.51771 Transcript_23985/m.51771 type:complete len:496 (-) Transcript_23985:262-1749(-)
MSRTAIAQDGTITPGMSHPLIESQPLVDRQSNGPSATDIKKNFLRMTALFAINHGCTVSCLDLANARLGSIGVWQSGILYASYTLSALCGASYFVKKYGSRNGLILGMGMSASYVSSFFLVSLIVEKNWGYGWLHEFVAFCSAVVGGVGGAILWVSQGGYFSSASQQFALKGGGLVEDATSRFGGNFAFALLLFEVILRLLSTFFIETAGLSWKIIFGLYSMLAILPVFLMMDVIDLEGHQYRSRPLRTDYGSDEGFEEENNSPSHKATATLDLLRKDKKARYLSPLNILFGLSTAFCSSVLNGAVLRLVLSDPNSTFVGFYTSTTSMVAAGASLLFGRLQSSHGRFHCGKGPVMTLGAFSYLIIALQFIAFPVDSGWSRMSLLFVYILLGVGRATFEGTLRATFADMFPNEKEGAFGNIILFSGTASTMGYILSVTGALQCEKVSKYCMEYNDGSIHDVLVMELVIIMTAIIAIPSFWRAIWMFRMEHNVQNNS